MAAPDPSAPSGIGNLGNFIYVGTATGQIYATQVGGGSSTSTGASSNSWILVGSTANGLDGSQIKSIVTDPVRGSHEAYAVTSKGVYFIANSIPSATNPTPTWINITGDIFTQPYNFYGQSYNPTTDTQPYDLATALTSIVADWNYTIPNNPSNLNDGYHPALFVSANSGVYMSINEGQSWTPFPDVNFGAVTEGGYLPDVNVTDLSLSLGDINTNTGMPNLAGPYEPGTTYNPSTTPDPDLLMASTFGQGAFAINMAPMLLPGTVQIAPSDVSGVDASGNPIVTTITPVIQGLNATEISGFGNATWITVEDITNPSDPTIIGGFNPNELSSHAKRSGHRQRQQLD